MLAALEASADLFRVVGAAPAVGSATVIAALHHLKSWSGGVSGSFIPLCSGFKGPDVSNAHTAMLS